jgi:hypothetical protein
MGFRQFHLEGDAKIVVDAVNSGEEDRSWLGHLFEDIKGELNSLAGWKMTIVRRDGNPRGPQAGKVCCASVCF